MNFIKQYFSIILAAVVILVIVVLLYPVMFQEDRCFSDPVNDADFNVVVNSVTAFRDISCVEGSEIQKTLPVGEVLHVVSETKGWYFVVRSDGNSGWIQDLNVIQTKLAFTSLSTLKESGVLSDISGHSNEDAIWSIYEKGLVGGYDDGTFKPENTINRAELTKILIGSIFDEETIKSCISAASFTDVSPSDWFSPYVCIATNHAIVQGYDDNTYQPQNEINFAEASKIIVNSFAFDVVEDPEVWYKPYVKELQNRGAIPITITDIDDKITRGEIAEILYRLLEKITDKESREFFNGE